MNTEKTENRDERKLGRIAAEGTVNCPSCAANFSAKLPRCPYCGTMYLPASETEFMDKLDGIREDLGGIGDRIVQETRKNSRLLWKRLAAAGAAVLVLIAAVLIAGASARKREAARDSEELVWQTENFRLFDELFDAGEYGTLAESYTRSLNEGHNVLAYRRAVFCGLYSHTAYVAGSIAGEEADKMTASILCDEASLYRLDDETLKLTQQERDILEEQRRPLLEDMVKRFRLTEEETETLRQRVLKNGYADLAYCESIIERKGQ